MQASASQACQEKYWYNYTNFNFDHSVIADDVGSVNYRIDALCTTTDPGHGDIVTPGEQSLVYLMSFDFTTNAGLFENNNFDVSIIFVNPETDELVHGLAQNVLSDDEGKFLISVDDFNLKSGDSVALMQGMIDNNIDAYLSIYPVYDLKLSYLNIPPFRLEPVFRGGFDVIGPFGN